MRQLRESLRQLLGSAPAVSSSAVVTTCSTTAPDRPATLDPAIGEAASASPFIDCAASSHSASQPSSTTIRPPRATPKSAPPSRSATLRGWPRRRMSACRRTILKAIVQAMKASRKPM